MLDATTYNAVPVNAHKDLPTLSDVEPLKMPRGVLSARFGEHFISALDSGRVYQRLGSSLLGTTSATEAIRREEARLQKERAFDEKNLAMLKSVRSSLSTRFDLWRAKHSVLISDHEAQRVRRWAERMDAEIAKISQTVASAPAVQVVAEQTAFAAPELLPEDELLWVVRAVYVDEPVTVTRWRIAKTVLHDLRDRSGGLECRFELLFSYELEPCDTDVQGCSLKIYYPWVDGRTQALSRYQGIEVFRTRDAAIAHAKQVVDTFQATSEKAIETASEPELG